MHLILTLVICSFIGTSCTSFILKDSTLTDISSTARGPIMAQCQARCYQVLTQNTTIHHSKLVIGVSDHQEQETHAWMRIDSLNNSTETCFQCLDRNNASRRTCNILCTTDTHDCSNSCQCLRDEKVITDTISTSEYAVNNDWSLAYLQLVCKDAQKKVRKNTIKAGAVLILQLLNAPNTHENYALLVEYRISGGKWTHAFINDSLTIILRGLSYGEEYDVRVSVYGPNGRIAEPIVTNSITTLPQSYTPSPVREVSISNLTPQIISKYLWANVSWVPAADNVCCHKVVYFDGHRQKFESEPVCEGRSWSQHMNVTLGQIIDLHVCAYTNEKRESEKFQFKYQVPSCPDFGPNVTYQQYSTHCEPPAVAKLCINEVLSTAVDRGSRSYLDIEIAWPPLILLPHEPDIVQYRVTVNLGSGYPVREVNVTYNESCVRVEEVDVPYSGYEVSVQAENVHGILGPVKSNIRRDKHSAVNEITGRDWCICKVDDEIGPSSASTGPPVFSGPTALSTTALMAGAVVLVLLFAAIVILASRRYSQWRRFKRNSGRSFYIEEKCISPEVHSIHLDLREYEPLKKKIVDENMETPPLIPFPYLMHARMENLRFGEIIGEGAFGIVRCAQIRRSLGAPWHTVAVKMLKDDASYQEKRELQREVSIMKAVGMHPHLVCLIAYSAPNDPAPAPFLVVEYCELGDLQSFLRHQWIVLNNNTENLKYVDLAISKSTNDVRNTVFNQIYDLEQGKNVSQLQNEVISPAELLSIARQVALGMEYLSSNRVVHRDLAARNVLVTADRSVKIADFGLSRDIYEQNVYRKTSEGKLPIKWMAIESLVHQMYTTASDIWSYGVLLWEIVTLGGTPYPGIPTINVLQLLKTGYRMERPEICSEELYQVMLTCWQARPSDRPSFSQIREKIENLLETCSSSGPYLPVHDYCIESNPSSNEDVKADVSYIIQSKQATEKLQEDTS